ncbi:hypothetical protein [Acinetobacter shaoyimingii]|uniref:Uncharacterized protein n=1 Tax=Acinetobacter shaoyimingii TaxID=2715164 RepID=A0A6G8RWH4_9GAMM|nr:hypothetical protein [Acinetobacter shaoyimingii]NHB57084.1 hypothetical protein [Acinetobacter shaoyimingii]QIO06296.1 hypothetical protein G8E00_10195 [Acinetobacter shaoyimingii]
MNKTLTLTATLLTAGLLTACASTPTQTRAIQNANNQYEVAGLGNSQVISKNNAIDAAYKTCGKKATPVLASEKTEYNGALKGVVSEKTGQVVTAATSVLGSIFSKGIGLEKDTDYQTVLTFTCRATS